MKELYWISVLGNLHIAAIVIAIFTSIAFFIFLGIYLDNFSPWKEKDEDYCKEIKLYKKILIIFSASTLISVLAAIFIPCKNDLYITYGIGTTIDYLQENPEAQQFPDKTIKMLNAVADKYLEDTKIEE